MEGGDYCVIAADTRLSTGYNILTRDYSKISELADKCALASSGFQADIRALQKHLAARHLGRGVFSHMMLFDPTRGLDTVPKVQDAVTPLSESEAINLVKTCFASATERDIYNGDKLEIVVLNADGIRCEPMELRKV